MKHFKRYVTFFVLLFTLLGLVLVFNFYSPEEVVDRMGVENVYIFIFLVAIFGGVSVITSGSFFATYVTMVLGGMNPVTLAIIGGFGLTIGDAFFYYMGIKGRDVAYRSSQKERLEKLSKWVKREPDHIIFILVYLYAGFSPFPKDVLSAGLALAGYPLKKAVLPLLLGNITFTAIIGFLSLQGLALFT